MVDEHNRRWMGGGAMLERTTAPLGQAWAAKDGGGKKLSQEF